jgi:hypothetical protein
MRKLLFSVLLAASATTVFAQPKLDDVQEKLSKGKFDEAKEKLDKAFTDPKTQTSSEAWYMRAKTYAGLAKVNNDTALRSQALQSMERYFELERKTDETKRNLKSMIDNHQPAFDLYSGAFSEGVKQFQAKNWDLAYYNFRAADQAFRMLSTNKITNVSFDTTGTLYAGIAAQNAKRLEDAATYYDRIIDQKIADTTFLDVYQFMIYHNLSNTKDTAKALRYLETSQATFPNKSETWMEYRMDMLSKDPAQRIAQYEQMYKQFPNKYIVAMNYGIELYNHALFNEPRPKDIPAAKTKALDVLQRAAELDPNAVYPQFILSQFYINEVYEVEEGLRAIKGNTPAEAAKRKETNARRAEKYELLFKHSQRAYELYNQDLTSGKMKSQDKANYRKTVLALVDYYQYKKQDAKAAELQAKLKSL